LEGIIFGFLAYFGAELGEYAHEKYNEIRYCIQHDCENNEPQGEIKIVQDEYIVVEHKLGDDDVR